MFVIYDIACSLSKHLKVCELVTFHRFFKYSFCIRMLGEMIFFKKYRCAYRHFIHMATKYHVRYCTCIHYNKNVTCVLYICTHSCFLDLKDVRGLASVMVKLWKDYGLF